MMRLLASTLCFALTLFTMPVLAQESDAPAAEETPAAAAANPQVSLETSKGTIVIELFQDKAPGTVKNFLEYVESGFYDGTIFHRVIPKFMVQGGGYTPDLKKKDTRPAVQNEADNGLKNTRGTLAMARTADPHSATAQFFINVVDNDYLDHTAKNPRGWGYCVFAQVIEGMDVADAITQAATTRKGPLANVPVDDVLITKASVVSP